jgi:hypothetical protein
MFFFAVLTAPFGLSVPASRDSHRNFTHEVNASPPEMQSASDERQRVNQAKEQGLPVQGLSRAARTLT